MNEHENEAPEEIEAPEAFHIDNEKAADWLLRKLNDCDAATERAKLWAAEIAETEAKRKQHLMERFGVELESYSREQLHGKKQKSFKLPSGTLGFRSTASKLVVTDEGSYTRWVVRNLTVAVEHKYIMQVNKAAVNEYFEVNGVLPDGCQFVPAEEKFYVK